MTHIRAFKTDKELLDSLRCNNENAKDTLGRVLRDYKKRGVKREIVRIVDELQHLCTVFVHADFHHPLELVKATLMKATYEDMTKRAERARVLTVTLQTTLEGFYDSEPEEDPDAKEV